MTRDDAKALAEAYRQQFGWQLRGRLATLAHRYADVKAPNFISWEGETLTGADTSAKVREMLKVCPWVD